MTDLPQPAAPHIPHVVIIGGGFAGLNLAKTLRNAPVKITLIDRQNHHLFQPLLYQVATAGLSAAEIAEPIRDVLRKQRNVSVLLGEVTDIDPVAQTITLERDDIAWDYLYLAAGASHSYFGNDHWGNFAPGLKTLDDAMEIRRRMIISFERAERADTEAERRQYLSFVVVGAGPTGVELAGALAEISKDTLSRNFRNFDPSDTQVMLVEAGPRVLSAYGERLSDRAKEQLESLGVQVLTDTPVTDIGPEGVMLGERFVPASTVLWAAGVGASRLASALGVPLDRAGRVIVEPNLTVPNHPNISVLGDLSSAKNQDGVPVPGLAPAAMQMGVYAGKRLIKLLKDKGEPQPFRYKDKGQMSTIGRRRAVAKTAQLEFSGVLAWYAWVFIHIYFIVGFRNRVAVFLNWMWAYVTRRRGARILFGVDASAAAPRRVREQQRAESDTLLSLGAAPEELAAPARTERDPAASEPLP